MNFFVALLGRAGIFANHPRSPSRLFRGGLRNRLRLALAFFTATLAAHAGYRIESIPRPAEMRGGIVGVGFSPTGTLVVCTRYGEVWMRPSAGPTAGAWRRFARGLNEPLGLVVESDRVVWIAHRPELLKCADTDGDGVAETFDALGGQWGMSNNYHEFFFGLRRDAAGNFLGVLSLSSRGDKLPIPPAEGARPARPHARPRSRRPVFRSAVARLGDQDRARRNVHADRLGLPAVQRRRPQPGRRALRQRQPGRIQTLVRAAARGAGRFPRASRQPEMGTRFRSEKFFHRASVAALQGTGGGFPHGPMGVSGGEPVWDTTGGKFGPFAGQVFAGDYTRLVVRASLEQVAGAWQGACFPFLGRNENAPFATGEKLIAGVTRGAFAPDGSLYLGASAGWGAGADGIQRVVWDGTVPPEVRDITITERGFRVSFTRPMAAAALAAPANFEITRFRYYYQAKYGSPRVDEARAEIRAARPAADGRSVELELADLQPVLSMSFPSPRSARRATSRSPTRSPTTPPTASATARARSATPRACRGPTRPRSAPRRPTPRPAPIPRR